MGHAAGRWPQWVHATGRAHGGVHAPAGQGRVVPDHAIDDGVAADDGARSSVTRAVVKSPIAALQPVSGAGGDVVTHLEGALQLHENARRKVGACRPQAVPTARPAPASSANWRSCDAKDVEDGQDQADVERHPQDGTVVGPAWHPPWRRA